MSTKLRSQQACDPCRSLKVRCLPSTLPGVCAKCLRSKSVCVWAEQPTRVRRQPKTTAASRVSTLESKIDELLAHVNKNEFQMSQSSNGQGIDATIPTLTETTGFNTISFTGEPRQTPSSTMTSLDGLFSSDEQHIFDVLLRCGLSEQDMESSLAFFKTMTPYFPFVVIPPSSTAVSLACDRPYTLFAAMAVSSINHALQPVLEQHFRKSVLEEVIMNGERSLDILNGLLIYLAWYHFFYVPKKEQAHQLLRIAAGMVSDLGLQLRPSDAVSRRVGLRLSHYDKATQENPQHDDFFSSEARRAYLGCYYLCKKYKGLRGKDCPLEFNPYMMDCASSLSHAKEYETDFMIFPLIQLQHDSDEMHESLIMAVNSVQTSMSKTRVWNQLAHFQAQMKSWRSQISSTVETDLAYQTAFVEVFEMDLLTPFMQINADSNDAASPLLSSSIARLDILTLCAQHIGEFFKTFLAIPAVEYNSLAFLQWNYFIFAILYGYKLSLGLPHVPDWDFNIARSSFDIEYVLDTVSHRMEDLWHDSSGRTDLFSLFGPICNDVKQKYQQLKHLHPTKSAYDTSPVHRTSFPPRQRHGCPGLNAWKKLAYFNSQIQRLHPAPDSPAAFEFNSTDYPVESANIFTQDIWNDWSPEDALGTAESGFID